jgi:hypothetical protein
MRLLSGFAEADRSRPATYEALIQLMGHNRLAVRHLAYLRLAELGPAEALRLPFDSTAAPEARAMAVEAWRKRIREGKLPPTEGR